jgi:hypothetical protein
MKLILITLVAVVVGMMVACGEGDTPQPTASSPKLTEKEAVALAKISVVGKTWIAWAGKNKGKPVSCEDALRGEEFDAKFDDKRLVWTVTTADTDFGQWEVYEKFLDSPKGAVVSVGYEC